MSADGCIYADPPRMTLVRLCSAKRDETLQIAGARLRDFAARARLQNAV